MKVKIDPIACSTKGASRRGRGRPRRPDLKPFRQQARAIFWEALLVLRAKNVAGRNGEQVSFRSVIREAYRRAGKPPEECNAFLRRVETPEFRALARRTQTRRPNFEPRSE